MLAATSVAMGSVQRRHETIVPPQVGGSATATCKHGQSALAGGFAAPGFDPSTGDGPVARFDSMPAGRRGITTKAFNFGQKAGKLESFAYCGKRAHPPQIVSKRVRIFPNGDGTVVARCPHGSMAIAGGFGTNRFSKYRGPEILTLTSKRTGERGWKVAGFNIAESGSLSGPGWLTAYAYCKSPGPKTVTRSKDAKVGGGGVRTLEVKCPNRSKAFSGGFNGHFRATQTRPTAAAAITSRRVAHRRAWRTSALGISSPGRITAYVYCHR